MDINENTTTLKLLSFDCSPDEITKTLNLEPTLTGIKGEEYSYGPRDKGLKKPWKHNYWEYRIVRNENTWIGEQINHFIETIIEPRKEKLKEIIKTCEGEFSIVQYYYDGCTPGYNFENKYLKTICEIGADLDIDIFCLGEEDE